MQAQPQTNKSRIFGQHHNAFKTPTVSVDTYTCTLCNECVDICLGESNIQCPNCGHTELSRNMPKTRTYLAQ